MAGNKIGWQICAILDAVARFAVPLFVIISGSLILNKKDMHFRYLVKKVLNFVFLIISWGLLYSATSIIFDLLRGISVNWSQELEFAILGPTPFWFIFMLIPLYIAAPVFQCILGNKEASRIYIGCWFLFSIVFESVESWIPWFAEQSQFGYISVFSMYSGFFLIGGYYRRYGFNKRVENSLIIAGIISLIVIAVGQPVGYFHNFTTPFACLYSIAVMVLVKRIPWQDTSTKMKHMIVFMSSNTFGIYALHEIILKYIAKAWGYSELLWFLQVAIVFVAVILVSIVVIFIVRKIPGLRRIMF